MDTESSTKFIGSLTKFLQSLCNGYVEFDDGVELIGHIYLNVDSGKSGKTLNYFLNEKVCKSDNSVTFISNSFHAQPEAKSKASSGKDSDSRKEDGDISDSGDNVPKSTNVGTLSSRSQLSSRSGASPNQNRTGVQIGTKRPGSPLKGPPPSQRRGHSPPSQRRLQSSGARATGSSPVSKTVPSSPSSSSQDNVPSPSISRKHRNEGSQPTSNQSDNVNADNENDMLSIHPTPEFASFLGSLTSDNQTSQDQPSPPDTKPDTDVTFIKEEFVSEPSSCAQGGSSGHSGRSGEDSSGLYPVMLHQNTSVFPSTSAGYHGYQAGASATATSQHGGFPGTSSSQSDPFNPVPGTSQDGADPSVWFGHKPGSSSLSTPRRRLLQNRDRGDLPSSQSSTSVEDSAAMYLVKDSQRSGSSSRRGSSGFRHYCRNCGKGFAYSHSMMRHRRKCEGSYSYDCQICGKLFHRRDLYVDHMSSNHNIVDVPRHRQPLALMDDMAVMGSGLTIDDMALQVTQASALVDDNREQDESAESVAEVTQHIAQPLSVEYSGASNDQEEA